MEKKKKLQIHNSTMEFLIFQLESKEEGIEVLYKDDTLWLTQDAIAVLFDKGRSTITEHLQNIFQSQELQEDSVCRKFRRTAADGKNYATKYYNLDAVPYWQMQDGLPQNKPSYMPRVNLKNTASFKTSFSNRTLTNTAQAVFLTSKMKKYKKIS